VNECGTSGYSLHALEVRRFRVKGADVLIPHLHGTTTKVGTVVGAKHAWTEPEFFKKLEASVDKKIVLIARELFEWSRDKADRVWFGTGKETGSFTFHYFKDGATVSVFTVYTNGKLMLNYGWLLPQLGPDTMKELHEKIIAIPTFRHIPAEFSKWPYLVLEEAFPSKKEIEDFKKVVEWLRELIQR
jgi:hypothetical protein